MLPDLAPYSILSLDVFDTALWRRVLSPTDVFPLAAERANLPGVAPTRFRAARIAAEAEARRRASDEITLDAIYAVLGDALHLSLQTLNTLKAAEIETERALSRPNPTILAFYEQAKRMSKRVIFLSDMYLPESVIADLLARAGYDGYERLIVSSAVGKTKHSGALFHHTAQTLNILPRTILHLGDDPHSDHHQAWAAGWNAHLIPKISAHTVSPLPLPTPPEANRSSAESQALALIHQDYAPTEEGASFWEALGWRCAGLLYYGFAVWLLRRVQEDKVRRLFFLSRDGYILRQAFQLVVAAAGVDLPSTYLYASRRALNVPAIHDLSRDDLDFLVGGLGNVPLRMYLTRIGLDPTAPAVRWAIQRAGFPDDAHRITATDHVRLRALFTILETAIRALADAERPLAVRYLKENGFYDGGDPLGVVDVGWHGSMQGALGVLWRWQMGKNAAPLRGYYVGTFDTARYLPVRGYLCADGKPSSTQAVLRQGVEIIEFLLDAPHGSVLGYREGEGAAQPIFSKALSAPRHAAAEVVHAAGLAFVRQMLEAHGVVDLPAEAAFRPLAALISTPTPLAAQRLGVLPHTDSFGEGYLRPIAQPITPLRARLFPMDDVGAYQAAFWRPGYLAQISPRRRRFLERYGG
ncbi:MAG TPA: HAD-IA family hydrolase [Aggregatilineales bacterium]|nr:HAD-IA family hydrolase [Anaerolineales bacterium]HRE46180.1 HAD-IA family hydrolase [Aggregatilineales bacterium]